MTRVGILAYEGVDELDLVGVFGPLSKAAQCREHDARLEVILTGPRPAFLCSGGIRMEGAAPLEELMTCAALVVPGGRGAEHAAANTVVLNAVRRATERGTALFTVCTGALLVAAAGVRPGRIAVHSNKHHALRAFTSAEISHGLIRDPELVSIGGRPGPGVKSVDMAFEVLRQFAPECVPCVAGRMELISPPD